MSNHKIVVIGAGLCGSLLAIRLKQRGFDVELFEKRPDMRKAKISAGRSINLALSNRGLKALKMIGLEEKARKITIPMRGRMLHDREGELFFSPYSGREGDYINSISRGQLNSLLYDEAEKLGININFNMGCVDSDPDSGWLTFEDENGKMTKIVAEAVFGADGAGSAIRKAAMERSNLIRFNFSQDFLTHGYKELSIPPGPNQSFRIEKNALHIWPRKTFMMIGLPNPDATFTMTLFLPFEGKDGFDAIRSDEDVFNYFKKWFPDAIPHMPNLIEEYHDNPTSSLGTIRCFPWQTGKRTLLIGDAAHAIVPFYGQGMNCAFEDVVVLDKIMDQTGSDWERTFSQFQRVRKPDADAIADLAIDNFLEMRDRVADPVFMQKRKLEMELEKNFPEYYSKYSMVTFLDEMRYSEALKKGRKQDEFLLELCRREPDIQKLNFSELLNELGRL
ncbi:MAG: FAD-dependent monooxygenase [Saprospirales bacterium]|nr:MAG: FAD-dependent monooxygenase [Saprospirales bacterium]